MLEILIRLYETAYSELAKTVQTNYFCVELGKDIATKLVNQKTVYSIHPSEKCNEFYNKAESLIASIPDANFTENNFTVVLLIRDNTSLSEMLCFRLFSFLLMLFWQVRERKLSSSAHWKDLRQMVETADLLTADIFQVWQSSPDNCVVLAHCLYSEQQELFHDELKRYLKDKHKITAEQANNNNSSNNDFLNQCSYDLSLVWDLRGMERLIKEEAMASCIQYCWMLRSYLYRFCAELLGDFMELTEEAYFILIDPCTCQPNFLCAEEEECVNREGHHFFNTRFPLCPAGFARKAHSDNNINNNTRRSVNSTLIAQLRSPQFFHGAMALIVDWMSYGQSFHMMTFAQDEHSGDEHFDFSPACAYAESYFTYGVNNNNNDNTDRGSNSNATSACSTGNNNSSNNNNMNNNNNKFHNAQEHNTAMVIDTTPPAQDDLSISKSNNMNNTASVANTTNATARAANVPATVVITWESSICVGSSGGNKQRCTLFEQLVLYYIYIHELHFSRFNATSYASQYCFDNKLVYQLSEEMVTFFKQMVANGNGNTGLAEMLTTLQDMFKYHLDEFFSKLTVAHLRSLLTQRFKKGKIDPAALFSSIIQFTDYRKLLNDKWLGKLKKLRANKKQKLDIAPRVVAVKDQQQHLAKELVTFSQGETNYVFLQHFSSVHRVVYTDNQDCGNIVSTAAGNDDTMHGDWEPEKMSTLVELTDQDIIQMLFSSKRLVAMAYHLWQMCLVRYSAEAAAAPSSVMSDAELVATVMFHFFPRKVLEWRTNGTNAIDVVLQCQPELLRSSLVICTFPDSFKKAPVIGHLARVLREHVLQTVSSLSEFPSICASSLTNDRNNQAAENDKQSTKSRNTTMESNNMNISILQAVTKQFPPWSSEHELVQFIRSEVRLKSLLPFSEAEIYYLFNVLGLRSMGEDSGYGFMLQKLRALRAVRYFPQLKWVCVHDKNKDNSRNNNDVNNNNNNNHSSNTITSDVQDTVMMDNSDLEQQSDTDNSGNDTSSIDSNDSTDNGYYFDFCHYTQKHANHAAAEHKLRWRTEEQVVLFERELDWQQSESSKKFGLYIMPHPQEDRKYHFRPPSEWKYPHQEWLCLSQILFYICSETPNTDKKFAKKILDECVKEISHPFPLKQSYSDLYFENKLTKIYPLNLDSANDEWFFPKYAIQNVLDWLKGCSAFTTRPHLMKLLTQSEDMLVNFCDQKTVPRFCAPYYTTSTHQSNNGKDTNANNHKNDLAIVIDLTSNSSTEESRMGNCTNKRKLCS
jgi:hypothetical protein